MKITQVNYDAGRDLKTYAPLPLSMHGDFFPNYPKSPIPSVSLESVKMVVVQKVRYINRNFEDAIGIWREISSNSSDGDVKGPDFYSKFTLDSPDYDDLVLSDNLVYRYKFTIESIILSMRQVIDYLVQLTCFLVDGEYSRTKGRVRLDSIGSVLKVKGGQNIRDVVIGLKGSYEVDHTGFLEVINDLANSYKHSFVHPESHGLIGVDWPTIVSYYVKGNDYSKGCGLYLNHNAYHIMMGFHDSVMRILGNQKLWCAEMKRE